MSNWYEDSGKPSLEGASKCVKEIDAKINSLQRERARIFKKVKETNIEKLKKEFLNSSWVLKRDLTLRTNNLFLAKKLAELDESGEWDSDNRLSNLFGNEHPFLDIYGCTSLIDDYGEKLTGEIVCELKNVFVGKGTPSLALLEIGDDLEHVLPYFKNLKVEYEEIHDIVRENRDKMTRILDLLLKTCGSSDRIRKKRR
jgi:hypothetical protein